MTQARIGLARAGSAVSTQALLEFNAAHARARDAVWCAWDIARCEQQLRAAGARTVRVASAARDRATYLKRPDLGRRLAAESVAVLEAARGAMLGDAAKVVPGDSTSGTSSSRDATRDAGANATRDDGARGSSSSRDATRDAGANATRDDGARGTSSSCDATREASEDDEARGVVAEAPFLEAAALDVALILSDGLSATAVHENGVGTMLALLAALQGAGLRCSPVILVELGRVALSDEIGHILGARSAVIVLGERPGLSAADSLGMYLTYAPAPGKTDAQRNCISNVREPAGMPAQLAAARLTALLRRSLALGVSGVALKDDGLVLP